MQNWIATCTLPHKDCVVQSSIEATVPSPCFGKRCARSSLVKGKIDWTMTSLKIYWELSISPSSLFSESSLSDVLLSKERRWWVTKRMQKNVDCRRCVKAWLSWNMAGHISAPVSLEWFPPSFKNRLKRIDLGKMMIDLFFFQTPWLNQKCWHLQNADGGWKQMCKEGQVGLWLANSQHLWVWNGSLQALKTDWNALAWGIWW